VSILQLFSIDQCYESVPTRPFRVGQVCWLVVPHIDPVPRILAVERSSPIEHEEVKFSLREATQQADFRASERILPLKHLKLSSHEELLVQKAKKRCGIVVSTGMELYPEVGLMLKQRGKKHLQEDCHFVVPCYSLQQDEFGTGFPREMKERIEHLLYRQFFYLPGKGRMRESIARFDRIQVVVGNASAAIKPEEMGLAGEFLALFMAMLRFCLTGHHDEDLMTARSLLRDAYSPQSTGDYEDRLQ
jgi:hypothetical protein